MAEGRRRALIVATSTFDDPGLAALTAPAADAAALEAVLGNPEIGGFEVRSLVDADASAIGEAIEEFFTEDVRRDDLLLLYVTGHGLKDDDGRLYFAGRTTRRSRLRSTGVAASFVNDVMKASRSRSQILVLDCCYSGAFASGLVAKSDPAVHTGERFSGRGRVVLTASDALQYSFEGPAAEGVAVGTGGASLFTSEFVAGLASGEADRDRDGVVTVDDAYEYVHDRLADRGVAQTPRKWAFDVEGDLVLARARAGMMVADPSPV